MLNAPVRKPPKSSDHTPVIEPSGEMVPDAVRLKLPTLSLCSTIVKLNEVPLTVPWIVSVQLGSRPNTPVPVNETAFGESGVTESIVKVWV